MQIKGKKALVTGASGFIGSHLVRRLIERGADISIISRQGAAMKKPRLADVWDSLDVHEVNICNTGTLETVVNEINPDLVYHLAVYSSLDRPLRHTAENLSVNVQGTVNLLHALEHVKYSCFVYTGTYEIYGDIPVPFKEDAHVRPITPHAVSKHAGEQFCMMYRKAFGDPVVALRLFKTYGPFQSCNRLVPEIISSALLGKNFKMTEGQQTREFNYIEDTVDGILRASMVKKAHGQVINIGSGKEVKIADLADRINRLMGNPIKILKGKVKTSPTEIWHSYCDNAKAKQILGWEPKVSLDAGLGKTIDWYTKELRRNPDSLYLIPP